MASVTLHGDPIRISGELPAVGSRAPDFNLIDTALNERTLAEFSGLRKVVNIVPSLDTPVCAAQARRFDQEAAALDNTRVLVVSADLPFAQARFCSTECTDDILPLSTVRSTDFGRAYGVLLEEGPLAGICARAVVVLDSDDTVLHAELVPEISEEPDYDAALAALR